VNLLRAYNRCLCLIVVLGITSFSTSSSVDGSSAALLAAFALPVAIGAWWLSVRHKMLLPRSVVNLLLLAVLAYAAMQAAARRFNVDGVAELVIFIQLIKLGDRRAPRDDAQILSLAVFLAIAAMLTSNGLWVGIQLLIFVPLLIATVMLFQLYSGWSRAAGGAPPSIPADAAAPRGNPGTGKQLRATTTFGTLATFFMAVVVFVIMPRGIGENAFGSWKHAGRGSVTGFTDHVKLGSRSVISESPKIVLDLTVREAGSADEEPGPIIGTRETVYYLRGAVLDKYDGGAWTESGRAKVTKKVEPFELVLVGQGSRSTILQTVTMRGMESQRAPLFAIWRPVRFRLDKDVSQLEADAAARTYRRIGAPGQVQYNVWSAIIEEPAPEPKARTPTSFPSDSIHALASDVLRSGGVDPDPDVRPIGDDLRAARLIQEHLQRGFTYSLSEPGVEGGEDPIEHFLFKTKTGHCEYFAAAMVAMCRSIGINARMIAGYVAAEFDESTLRYVVRESNAHAWVEVESGENRWRRFDPTPPDDLTRIHRAKPGLFGRLRRALDSVEYAWNTSIVGFDQFTQQRLLGPAGEERTGPLDSLSQRLRQVGPRSMLSSLGLGIAVFVGVAAVGLAARFLSALILRRLRRTPSGRDRQAAHAAGLAQIRFYQQLLDLLKKRGFPKPFWRPPMDHAAAIDAADSHLAAATRHLTTLYYQARFGGRSLSESDLAAAKQAIRDLSKRPQRTRGS